MRPLSSMSSTLVVTHERLGSWARQLRPRLATAGPIRWVESRSTADLAAAIWGVAAPVVLIDLADRPRAMLEDLDTAAMTAPSGLFLVLDPKEQPGASALAREIGATLVLSGWTSPPVVADLLARWLPLALSRSRLQGWSNPVEPEAEPWERFDLFAPTGAAPDRPA